MPIRSTVFKSNHYYHIYNRGNNRQKIFFERDNYLYFLTKRREHLVEKGVEIIAYCLMPNHYHLLVYLNDENVSEFMQKLALSYTKAINKRYKRVGSLFQGRFQSVLVDTDKYLIHLSRYIHLNPQKSYLVRKPENWEYSSYPEYINTRNGTLPNLNIILPLFSDSNAYRLFVEDYCESDEQIIKHLTFES
ncbi:MAG: transposase [Cyanobacteria bacterium J06633_8]